MTARCPSGFSLVELLVVIAIVAMLLALMMPTLKRAREAARRMTCASQVHQSGLSLQYYVDDHKGWYPSIRDYRGAPNQEISPDSIEWATLSNYGWSLRSLSCPSGSFKAKFRLTGNSGPLVMPYFYLAGRGDRTQAGNWNGYNDNQSYATRADNMRPVMRMQDTKLPHDTGLMTDLFRGETQVSDGTGVYVRFIERNGNTHDRVPSNHVTPGDALLRGDGTNLLTVDQAVRWRSRSQTILRWTVQYNQVHW